MKNLLVVPLVLLSFCVFADERMILGSFERQTQEDEIEYLGASFESISNGFGLQFLNFAECGIYFGAKVLHRTGESEVCVGSRCVSSDTEFNYTLFTGEVGRTIGDLTPFVGASYNITESDRQSVDGWGVNVGSWYRFDNFKLKGTITNVDDEFSRGISLGFLYPVNNKWTIGADIGTLLDSESDVISVSLQFGRAL